MFNALTILSILVVFFVISAHCKKETASIHVFKTFSKLLSQTVSNYSIFSEMVCKLFYDVNEGNLMFVKKTTWISAWNGMSKVFFFLQSWWTERERDEKLYIFVKLILCIGEKPFFDFFFSFWYHVGWWHILWRNKMSKIPKHSMKIDATKIEASFVIN